jgi:hypothetical protein
MIDTKQFETLIRELLAEPEDSPHAAALRELIHEYTALDLALEQVYLAIMQPPTNPDLNIDEIIRIDRCISDWKRRQNHES